MRRCSEAVKAWRLQWGLVPASQKHPEGLAGAGIVEAAVRDRTLVAEVAQHKEDFWRARDADAKAMQHSGMLRDEAANFA